MKRTQRKILALILAFATVLSLMVPMAGTARAEVTIPAYGAPTLLGNHLQGQMAITEFIVHTTYDGKDYLIVPAYGGILYVFKLSEYLDAKGAEGNWIYAQIDTGITVPGGIETGSNGNIYISGGSSVLIYNLASPDTYTTVAMPNEESVTGISVDSVDGVDTIFVNADKNNVGYVYKVTADGADSYNTELLFSSTDIQSGSSITSDNGSYVYAHATLDQGGSRIYKISRDGIQDSYYDLANTEHMYYLSYADGKLFGGHSASLADGMVVINADDMTKTEITVMKGEEDVTGSSSYIVGLVTDPVDGISYMNISGVGLCEYNSENDTATYIRGLSFNLRDRTLYQYMNSTYVLSMNVSGVPYLFRVKGTHEPASCVGLVAGAQSNWIARTLGAGVPGVGGAVYIGGYKTGKVASFNAAWETTMNHTELSNGHAQTDAILAYGDKLYLGCYSGAYLVEYDPATGEKKELIPGGLKETYSQIRIHALAAGDNKIFFSTVPGTAMLGGCIGWVDLEKFNAGNAIGDYLHVQPNVVENQILISLAYDETNKILYGASSIAGGSSSESTATEAVIMVYDVANKERLGNFPISSALGIDSENPPQYISGISIDPDGDKIWGNVYNTVFSFTYENDTISVSKEWTNGKIESVPYTNSGSLQWFPKNFLFSGEYMYVQMRTGGMYRLYRPDPDTTESGKKAEAIVDTSRIYTMGSDGNIYYALGEQLYRISLNQYSIVEDMIMNATDDASFEDARKAYDSLSEEEQAKMGIWYTDRLNASEGKNCRLENASGRTYGLLTNKLESATTGDTITLLADVTVETANVGSGAVLDLNGKNLTGGVSVSNGQLIDSVGGGTITLSEGQTLNVPQANSYMPLLDPDNQNYKLFEYEIVQTDVPVTEVGVGALNFWFDLEFTNPEAYTLLTGASNLTVSATLSWTQEDVDPAETEKIITFNNTVKTWAAQDHSKKDYGLYVQVTGIPLTGVSNITVTPHFETDTGISITLNPIDHDVVQFAGNANVGEFPNDVIND